LLHWLSRHRHLLCSPPRVRGRFFGSKAESYFSDAVQARACLLFNLAFSGLLSRYGRRGGDKRRRWWSG
jgi:hypothetical protein